MGDCVGVVAVVVVGVVTVVKVVVISSNDKIGAGRCIALLLVLSNPKISELELCCCCLLSPQQLLAVDCAAAGAVMADNLTSVPPPVSECL